MKRNETFEKFGGAENEYYSNDYWSVLIRVKQVTLGSSILICKRPINTLAELSKDELFALGDAIKEMEQKLKDLFNYDKINYLLLMMQDKEVHFHIFPRYSKLIKYANIDWNDSDWPKPPNLKNFLSDNSILQKILSDLKK